MSEQRLIDANALKRYIPTRMDMQDLYLPMHFKTLIDEQPTVDAVPVEWIQGFMDWLDSKGYTIASAVIQKMLNDFCADGERR